MNKFDYKEKLFAQYDEGKLTIAASILEEFIELTDKRYSVMNDYKEFTLQQLYGDEEWNKKTDYERRILGKCFAYLVAKEVLPFVGVSSRCQSPKKYVRVN